MSTPPLEVFRTEPLLLPKVWGGRKLSRLFGKSLPTDEPYGESWEVADLPEGQSTIASGALAEHPLRDAVKVFGARLCGTASPERFPLLVKLLDAATDLSVQVHPGPADARRRPGAHAKDECWLILDADRDGAILHGPKRVVRADELRTAAQNGTVLELLRRVPVFARDVFRVPPGTIHAICGGVALLEIQQPSDTTYRVYDYGRAGLDGAPRPLHLDAALEVASLGPTLPEDRGMLDKDAEIEVLANVDAYRIERFCPSAPMSWEVSTHTAQIVHVLRGAVCLDEVVLGPSQTAVIPAALGRVFLTAPEECELVVAGLGGPPLVAR